MKANAPEKIYLQLNIDGKELIRPWLTIRFSQDSVEYTRTDAFIKKARKWFEQMSDFFDFNGIRHYAKDDFEDFENYMRGE